MIEYIVYAFSLCIKVMVFHVLRATFGIQYKALLPPGLSLDTYSIRFVCMFLGNLTLNMLVSVVILSIRTEQAMA